MRANKYSVKSIHAKEYKGKVTYYWIPPVSLRKAGIFRFVTLGTDLPMALREAAAWNAKLSLYYAHRYDRPPPLIDVKPMTAAFIAREFEKSAKFAKYSLQGQKDYANTYRRIEVFKFDGERMFGDLQINEITRQIVYGIYEHHVAHHGLDTSNKMMSSWQAAFKYATLKIPGIVLNPFTQLGKETPPPRRQRWTAAQLEAFIQTADEHRYPSIGRCALMCLELVQRPGDILSLTWGAYREHLGAWHIRQSKRGAEVWVPPTKRLRTVL